MNEDLSRLLNDWPYEPGQITARFVEGADGQTHLQVRLDLGVLQMRTEGRPDGQKPFGHGSLLEYYEAKLDQSTPVGEDSEDQPKSEPFKLSAEDCRALRDEAVQYYHRY